MRAVKTLAADAASHERLSVSASSDYGSRMPAKNLFEATGSKTGFASTALLTIVMLGVVLSATMVFVAFLAPKMVGSPLIYVITFVLSIALGVWVFKKDKVTIRIVEGGDGVRAIIDGPTTKIDELLEPGSDHWVTFERMPAKMGGGILVRYSVVAKSRSGRALGFNLRAGTKGTEPADWPVREDALDDAEDVFLCPGIKGLRDALRGAGKDAAALV
jgi:hypothetical protein